MLAYTYFRTNHEQLVIHPLIKPPAFQVESQFLWCKNMSKPPVFLGTALLFLGKAAISPWRIPIPPPGRTHLPRFRGSGRLMFTQTVVRHRFYMLFIPSQHGKKHRKTMGKKPVGGKHRKHFRAENRKCFCSEMRPWIKSPEAVLTTGSNNVCACKAIRRGACET